MTTLPCPPKPLNALPAHDADGHWLVVIEAVRGTRSKLKYDERLHAFVLHHLLPLGCAFPLDFGFVPSTLGADGDPLDVLVLADEPLPAGTVVPCRMLGVLEAEQEKPAGAPPVRNDRLVAVAAASHLHAGLAFADLAPAVLEQLERFFVDYNAQRGVPFRVIGRGARRQAERLLAKGAEHWQSERGAGLVRRLPEPSAPPPPAPRKHRQHPMAG